MENFENATEPNGPNSPAPLGELPVSTCWSLLREVPIGRVALPGEPDVEVFPVNFLVDHGTIVFRTASGTKLALAGASDRATFEVDNVDTATSTAWSVVAKGIISIVSGHDEIVDIFDIEIPTWQPGSKPTYVRLQPDLVTGRRFPIAPA